MKLRSWSWSRLVDAGSVALVMASLAVLGFSWIDRNGPDLAEGNVPPEAPLPEGALPPSEFFALASTGRWIGPRDAPAVLLVYSSYACGFCQDLFRDLDALMRRYPDHLAVVVKHLADPSVLGRQELVPAIAAECAGQQDRFAEFHFAAFRNAAVLGYSDAAMILADSARIPDPDQFRLCVQSGEFRGLLVDQASEAARLGVTGTPTSFLNGLRILGALPIDELDRLVALQFPGRDEAEQRRSGSGSQPE